MKETIEYLLNLILHVIILFTILTVFFFVYISVLEKNAYQTEIESILRTELINQLNALPDPELVRSYFQNTDFDKYLSQFEIPNTYVTINNNWLMAICIIILAFLILLFFTIYFFVHQTCHLKLDMYLIVYENICLFSITGVIEILFFIYIAYNYVPVSPTVMLDSFISDIQEKLN